MPMPTMVTMSVLRRPILSPITPKIMPPMGRATSPTPNVAKAAMAAAVAFWLAKNWTLKTSAAAALKRKKSYHSMAVPMRAPMATLVASLSEICRVAPASSVPVWVMGFSA
ncbi:hypothetical protein D9M71_593630 [compost metagenome]